MPIYNMTIDDLSPVWQYKGQWLNDSKNEVQYNKYFNRAFHACESAGASVSLPFNGTAVYLYGSKRPNHAEYTVILDRDFVEGSSYSPVDLFQQELYSREELYGGSHLITLTDKSYDWLDLDYGIITVGDGNSSTVLTNYTLDDTSSNFTYGPGWSSFGPDSPEAGFYLNNTVHSSDTLGGRAILSFHGNAVAVYGSLSEDHGNYTVSLDGGDARTFNAYAMYNYSQFYANGLALEDHSLQITHVSNRPNTNFDLDFAIVSMWTTSPNVPATTESAFPQPDKRGLSTGAVAGIVASAVLALLSIAFAALWIMCRRRSRIRQDMDLTKEFFPTRPTKAYANGSWSSDAPLTRSADPGVIILGQNSETFSQQAQRGQSEGHLTENPVPGSPVLFALGSSRGQPPRYEDT